MKRFFYLVTVGIKHPLAFLDGMREFNITVTDRYGDDDLSESYDCGREIANILTFRRFETC